MRLTAKRAFRYRGRDLKPGDAFDAEGLDARAFKGARIAEDAPEPPAKRAKPEAAELEAPPPKEGRYKTRRLKADDD